MGSVVRVTLTLMALFCWTASLAQAQTAEETVFFMLFGADLRHFPATPDVRKNLENFDT